MRLETAPTGPGGKYRITELFSETSLNFCSNLKQEQGKLEELHD